MIFDKLAMFLDHEAFNATPAVVDTGEGQGRGEPIKISVNCGGGDMAGLASINVLSDDTATPSTTVASFPATPADVNGKIFSFHVTPDQTFGRYMTLDLQGATAGTDIVAGIVKDAQTED